MLSLELNLKDYLKRNNLTQTEVANLTGIRQASISEMCNMRKRSLNLDHLEKLINHFQIERLEELLKIRKED